MPDTFIPLTIKSVTQETADAISVLFEVPESAASQFSFRPGQHLTLRADVDGEEIRRNYSLCAAPSDGQLRVAIKAIVGGRFSNWAKASLTPGKQIDVMPPHGSFTWNFSDHAKARYLGMAGGSGITPILSLMKTALLETEDAHFTLLYGNRASPDIIFLEEIAALKDQFLTRLEVYHFLEDEAEDIALFNGRLDADKLSDVMGRLVDPSAVTAAFICGPGPMMDAAEAALENAGLSAEQILLERFTAGRPSAAEASAFAQQTKAAAGKPVMLKIDGRSRKLTFTGDETNILDAARAAGLPAPYACKAGVCATCRAKLVSGSVSMAAEYGLSEDDKADGYVLTCQAVPTSDDVVLDYEG